MCADTLVAATCAWHLLAMGHAQQEIGQVQSRKECTHRLDQSGITVDVKRGIALHPLRSSLRARARLPRMLACAAPSWPPGGRMSFGSRRPDGGVGTLLAGLAGLGTYFLASPGCSRELALLAFGKLAERVDLIAFVETSAGDVVEDGHLLGASYIAGDGAPPFAGLYGDVGHEPFQVLVLRT